MLASQRKILLNLLVMFKIGDFSRKMRNALNHTYLDVVKHLIQCYTDICVYLMEVK